jgi:hypothetical protein
MRKSKSFFASTFSCLCSLAQLANYYHLGISFQDLVISVIDTTPCDPVFLESEVYFINYYRDALTVHICIYSVIVCAGYCCRILTGLAS